MAPHFLSRNINASVINAGDGFHAHPTQALLDAYSIMEHLGRLDSGSLEGLSIGIIGDIKHSRVARSDIEVFKKLGAKVTLCGPPTLVPDDFELYGVDISYNLDDLLPESRRDQPAEDTEGAAERLTASRRSGNTTGSSP